MAVLLSQTMTSPVLIGRQQEQMALHQCIGLAKTGRSQGVLINGEAGVGKSRLLLEAGAYATAQEFLLFRLTCFQADSAVPYAPLLEPLRPYVADTSPPHKHLRPLVEELSLLLPALAPTRPDFPQIDPQQKKQRLLMVLAEFFAQLATRQPIALMVEDAHWSDETTLEFLHYLLRRDSQRIILLVTYRSDEISPEFGHWLTQLKRQPFVHQITVEQLSFAETTEMLRAILDGNQSISSEGLHLLYTLTEGNPFFIEEVLKSLLITNGLADQAAIRTLEIPHTIQAVVQQRLAHLGDATRHIIQLAAVMGRHFDFAVLQQLTQQTDAALLVIMKELIAAQLIVEASAERFEFRHPLTRQAIYTGLLARERRALHQTIAQLMATLYSANPDAYIADLAYHFYEAEDWEPARHYSIQAGDHAQSLYALRPAIEHFTRAIEASQQLGESAPSSLYRARGLNYEMLGEFRQATADLEVVLAQAEAEQNQAAKWQALLDLGLLWSGQDYAQTEQFYQRAFELACNMEQPIALANSLNRLGNWHLNAEHPVEAHWYHQEAHHIFQTQDDTAGIAATLDLLGMASYLGGNLVQGTAYYQQAVAHFYALDQRPSLISSLATLTMGAPTYQTDTLIAGIPQLSIARQHGETALSIAREIGHRSGEIYAMIMLGMCVGSQGDYQTAFDLLQNALMAAQDLEHRQWMTAAQVALGALYAEALSFSNAIQHLQAALERANAIQSLHWQRNAIGFLASTHIQQGELGQAESLLTSHLDFNLPIRTLGQRLMWRAWTELMLARGDGEAALQAVKRLQSMLPIPRLAMLESEAHRLLGQYEMTEMGLLQAIECARQQGAVSLEWRIQATLIRLYEGQSQQQEARQHRAALSSLITALAAHLPEALRDEFRQQALAQTPADTASPRPDELTPREREIASLVATGQTNRQMAQQLVLSERTIETHVGNILAKLHLTSRTQVAIWAIETGLISQPDA